MMKSISRLSKIILIAGITKTFPDFKFLVRISSDKSHKTEMTTLRKNAVSVKRKVRRLFIYF